MKSIGYTEVISVTKSGALASIMLNEEDSPLPRPDTSQMIPYKPKVNAQPGEHPVPGGTFPYPPAAAHLCTLLPPPSCFHGPFVSVDLLMEVFNRITLPETGNKRGRKPFDGR